MYVSHVSMFAMSMINIYVPIITLRVKTYVFKHFLCQMSCVFFFWVCDSCFRYDLFLKFGVCFVGKGFCARLISFQALSAIIVFNLLCTLFGCVFLSFFFELRNFNVSFFFLFAKNVSENVKCVTSVGSTRYYALNAVLCHLCVSLCILFVWHLFPSFVCFCVCGIATTFFKHRFALL